MRGDEPVPRGCSADGAWWRVGGWAGGRVGGLAGWRFGERPSPSAGSSSATPARGGNSTVRRTPAATRRAGTGTARTRRRAARPEIASMATGRRRARSVRAHRGRHQRRRLHQRARMHGPRGASQRARAEQRGGPQQIVRRAAFVVAIVAVRVKRGPAAHRQAAAPEARQAPGDDAVGDCECGRNVLAHRPAQLMARLPIRLNHRADAKPLHDFGACQLEAVAR